MNWPVVTIVGVALVAFFILKRMSLVSAIMARKHLAAGALVIDVRSPEEFRSGHVTSAVNIPLGGLRENLPSRMQDKNQVLLLYCLSGGRSGIAKHRIKWLGYQNVFNLGSYGRAQEIVSGPRGG